jgi:hypothetical protein
LFFTAVYGEANPPTHKGTCEACSDGISDSSCGNDQDRNESTNLPTYMVISDSSPTGPWSEPALIPGTDTDVDSNFSPVINANGSLTALTRNDVWYASDWSNVSSYAIVNTQWCADGEDPFLWVDGRGVYHCLVHVNREETYGVHYWSLDGVDWQATCGGGKAYTSVVEYANGQSIDFACRERFHVVLDDQGRVVASINGAAEDSCHTAGQNDHSYTLLQTAA